LKTIVSSSRLQPSSQICRVEAIEQLTQPWQGHFAHLGRTCTLRLHPTISSSSKADQIQLTGFMSTPSPSHRSQHRHHQFFQHQECSSSSSNRLEQRPRGQVRPTCMTSAVMGFWGPADTPLIPTRPKILKILAGAPTAKWGLQTGSRDPLPAQQVSRQARSSTGLILRQVAASSRGRKRIPLQAPTIDPHPIETPSTRRSRWQAGPRSNGRPMRQL
jgi:hypothetical protein